MVGNWSVLESSKMELNENRLHIAVRDLRLKSAKKPLQHFLNN